MKGNTAMTIVRMVCIVSVTACVSAADTSEPNQLGPTGKISANRLNKMKENWSGEIVGIGVSLKDVEKGLLITDVLSDTAKEAGLKAGQIITAVETTKTTEVSMKEAIDLIKGPESTTVNLRILHPDGKTQAVSVVRKKFIVTGVSSEIVEQEIAVFKIYAFNNETAGAMMDALDEYVAQNIKGVVLDLRVQLSGHLSEMVKIAELFIPPKRILWLTRAHDKESMERTVTQNPAFCDLPMVVLVNEQTGPAELIAAAMKRTRRATLVGRQTSGLAASKKLVKHPDGTADIKVVGAFYLNRNTPITGTGVKPDILMPETATPQDYIDKAVEILKSK